MIPIRCDICSAPMKKGEEDPADFPQFAAFYCTQCEQRWTVSEERTSCTILKTLFSSAMDPHGRLFREEYLPYFEETRNYRGALLFAAGIWDGEKLSNHVAESRAMVEEWLRENPLPPSSETS